MNLHLIKLLPSLPADLLPLAASRAECSEIVTLSKKNSLAGCRRSFVHRSDLRGAYPPSNSAWLGTAHAGANQFAERGSNIFDAFSVVGGCFFTIKKSVLRRKAPFGFAPRP